MRITSGKARGISLKSPKGDATRPATDAARLAVFSSIADFVEGALVYDFFAGTGSYGLEALSRGARGVVFFENSRGALGCIRENVKAVEKSLGARADARVVARDVFAFKPEEFAQTPDLVFADPPYEMLKDNAKKVLSILAAAGNAETIFVLEAPADFEPDEDGNPFETIKRLGKKSKGKPSQLIMKLK